MSFELTTVRLGMVFRTLVRHALFQLAQNKRVQMEPARGAYVAAPSVEAAKQVFAVRRMTEAEMTRPFVSDISPEKIAALREHIAQERNALSQGDVSDSTELPGDIHVRMAELMGKRWGQALTSL